MKILRTYEEFIERVNECGFMTLSEVLTGLPSLAAETEKSMWHTGDNETDPWSWKSRCAKDKKLAFGCIIGGHKGFVSSEMYHIFYAAYHPEETMETRWKTGKISQTLWTLWNLFNEKGVLSTKDLRDEMGVTKKKGGSAVDTAIKQLQKEYYITVAGTKRKINKLGEPYGWPANTYELVVNWIPKEWADMASSITQKEACEEIINRGIAIGVNIDKGKLQKVLKL
ncbi:AlkZ-related protein [Wukongibacter sp. M2B1]|uniref:AlkZ-related protein n=1 Tax=Wukongibacter sp. M2B1 TaxID=3088895 RepID=UPI003D78FFB5